MWVQRLSHQHDSGAGVLLAKHRQSGGKSRSLRTSTTSAAEDVPRAAVRLSVAMPPDLQSHGPKRVLYPRVVAENCHLNHEVTPMNEPESDSYSPARDDLFRRRRVNRPATAFESVADVITRRQEASRQRRQRRHFIGIEWSDQARRISTSSSVRSCRSAFALEQMADDRDLAEQRNRRLVSLRDVVD